MPSPFPGMDPYLESWIWASFHSQPDSSLGAQLNAKLPRRYIANTELFVWRDGAAGRTAAHAYSPAPTSTSPSNGPRPARRRPWPWPRRRITTTLPGVERKQRYLRIIDGAERRIVTVIEVLVRRTKRRRHGRGLSLQA